MAQIVEFFTQANAIATEYPSWLFWVGVVIVIALSEIAKLPIKYFTNKIPNDNLRKKINATIMLLPIGFGFMISWILTYFGFGFSVVAAMVWGTTSQVIYDFIARLIKRIKKGEDITTVEVKEDFEKSVESADTAEKKFKDMVGKIVKK